MPVGLPKLHHFNDQSGIHQSLGKVAMSSAVMESNLLNELSTPVLE
jgi:hypothetical protein